MRNLREQEDPQGLGADAWLGNLASGAGSGAAAGSAFGPIGTAVGGAAGLAVGIGEGLHQDSMLRAAEQQQIDLNNELADQSQHDRYLQMFSQAHSLQRGEEEMAAQQAAARGGLSPGEAEAMRQSAVHQQDLAAAQALPGLYLQATQDEMMRRQQLLNEYSGAQALANNAVQPSDWIGSLSGMVGAASQYGAMDKDMSKFQQTDTLAKETPPSHNIQTPVEWLPALPDTGTPAGPAWAPSGGVPGTGVGPNSRQPATAGQTTPMAPVGAAPVEAPTMPPAGETGGRIPASEAGYVDGVYYLPAEDYDAGAAQEFAPHTDPYTNGPSPEAVGQTSNYVDGVYNLPMEDLSPPSPETIQTIDNARSTGNYDDLFPEDIRRQR